MIQRMFVTLDTKKTNYKNVGKINHGDDLILELTVLSDGDMISFNDPMVDLLVKKSDGKMIRQNSGIEHIKPNKFVIEIGKDCVTSPGLSTNQLIINDNGRISTCMFYYTILNSLEEDIIQSISSVEVLEQLDEFTIQIQDKMENFDEKLQNRMSELEDAIDDLVEFFGDTSVDLLEAELSRNEAEQSRAQAESVRVQNESRRLQNDLDLANAEAERVRAENVRIQNEVDRALIDAVMDQKESKREDSELERIQNESKRAADELVRQQNENTRQSNESIRMSNETDRKTQENRRVTAETNRVNAETSRRNNENSRVSNENERQKAMNEMKSLIGNVNDFDERVGVIEDEIEEINSSLENNTNKNINILTPELFGAVGNGEIDDTDSIQEMFNSAKCGQKIMFKSNTRYLISKTIEVPKNVEVDGCGCFIMLDDSIHGQYAFKLGVIMGNNTLDTMMVQNEFKNFNIQHYGKPEGKYYHGINVIQQCKILNIYTWGLDRTIHVDSNYIDVVIIDGVNIWGKWGDNYAIDTGFMGDCRKVTNVHFLHETSSFNLLKIGDGHNTCRVEGIINGNIHVGKSMCELSNIHTEFGNITFNGSNATLKNLFILVPSDKASIVINDYSNISLENCMFNYYEGREYTPSSNYYDIEFEDVNLSNLSIKNCFKNMLPSSDIKFRVTNGINIKNCSDFNNNALGNSISSILKANRVLTPIQPYLRTNNSADYIKAIYEDSNFKWNKATGTYYYKCCLVYDETRKIGDTNKSNEMNKLLSLNGGASLIHMNGVPTSNIKLYRGTTSNSYSECVMLAPNTNKIYDRGSYANGCIWENRTSGAIDTYFKVYMYEKLNNGNVIVQATTTPTVGIWKDGDRIIQAVPKPGAIKGWIYNGTSWISEGTY